MTCWFLHGRTMLRGKCEFENEINPFFLFVCCFFFWKNGTRQFSAGYVFFFFTKKLQHATWSTTANIWERIERTKGIRNKRKGNKEKRRCSQFVGASTLFSVWVLVEKQKEMSGLAWSTSDWENTASHLNLIILCVS